MAAEATAEPTEARAIFGRDGLFSRACVTVFRRLVAPRALRSPADAVPLGGRASYRRGAKLFQGFPNFSKEIPRKFQGICKLFQTFPRISKLFPWPFRGKSRGYRSVEPETRLLQFLRRLGRDERPDLRRRTRSRFNIARIPIIGKKLSAAISRRGLGARAASHAPTRKPTAATPAPCNFDRVRRRPHGSLFFPKFRGCQWRAFCAPPPAVEDH